MARAECLHGGLLRGESSREVRRRVPPTLAVGNLPFGEDAMEEAIAITLDRADDSGDVGGVQTDADDGHGRMVLRVERLAQHIDDVTFRWTQESWGSALRCVPLEPIADHLFTTRELPLGLGQSDDDSWARVADAVGVPAGRLRHVRQVHGATVIVHRRSFLPPRVDLARSVPGARPEGDVLVSDDPSIALAVQVADCAPILIGDPRTKAVAAVHAGWRGTAARAVRAALRALAVEFDARPADLVAAIGPSIGPCCYQVGPELPGAFEAAGHSRRDVERWFSHHDDEPPGLRLDLWQASRDQLVAEGVDPVHVHVSGLCTVTRADLFCSYRRAGAAAGRMTAVIRPR